MTNLSPMPRWEDVATKLEADCAGPSKSQRLLAERLGVSLAATVPAPVAAIILREHLSEALWEAAGRAAEVPETLSALEDELELDERAVLVTGTAGEVSAWFTSRYMIKTARGLRAVKPDPGDVVTSIGWPNERRVVSSIGDDGRIYMKGHPPRKAWPNHLSVVARPSDETHAGIVAKVEAGLLNANPRTEIGSTHLADLSKYRLASTIPSHEAVRALEELLDGGEQAEEPYQALLTTYPSLLAAAVVATAGTYVIPKPRLGGEFVPDFLVLGINSVGPQWLLVELEAPKHQLLIKDGSLSKATRHAVKQVQDWREWLTENVAYAQGELKLYGLTNRAPGLVIIGRDTPTVRRQAARAQADEAHRIGIHSWDWVLRSAQGLSINGTEFSDFARKNVERQRQRGI